MYDDARTYGWEQHTGRQRKDPRLHRLSVEGLKVSPQESMVWNNMGLNSHQQGRFDEAIKRFDKAVLIDPKNSEAWNNKGMSYYSLGLAEEVDNPLYPRKCDYEYATKSFDEAIKLNPQFAQAWYNKGMAESSLGRIGHYSYKFDYAIYCFNEALKINPQLAEAWNKKALLEDKLGKKQDAAESFRKFIELTSSQNELNNDTQTAHQGLCELETDLKKINSIKFDPSLGLTWERLNGIGNNSFAAKAVNALTVEDLVTVLIMSTSKEVRYQALERLNEISQPVTFLDALISIVSNDSNKDMKTLAIRMLYKINNAQARDALVAATKDPDDYVRDYAAFFLKKLQVW